MYWCNHKIGRYTIAICSVVLLCCAKIFAQEKSDTIKHLSVQEVVVIGNKVSKEVIPVQVLTGEELKRLNAHSISDALRYFSGVQLKDYGGIGGLKTINVRSMGSQHVGVFYDGVEIGNPQNGVVDLGRYSLDNMESLSLYNGQKSAIFQPAKDFASASSIYMRTKTPAFLDDKSYNIKGTFKTGSFDLINPSVQWEQHLSANVSSSLGVDYTHSSGKYKFHRRKVSEGTVLYDTTLTRRNGDIRYLRIEQGFNGKIDNGEWYTRLYYYDSERGYPGFIDKNPSDLKFEDRQWDKDFFFQGSFKKNITDKYKTLLSAKYAYDHIHYVAGIHPGPPADNIYELHELYVSSANNLSLSSFWSANLSVDYMCNTMYSNMNDFIDPDRHSLWTALATSVYLDKVKIQASLLGVYIFDSRLHNIYSESGDYIGVNKIDETKTKITPSVVISYKPWRERDFSIRAFYKDIYRMPTFSEMHLVFMSGTSSILRPERARQYNFGVIYSKVISAKINIGGQFDAYYNDVTDKLVAVPGGRNFRWTMMNLGLVKIKGTDVAINGNTRLSKKLQLNARLNYTCQRAQDYTWEVESDYVKYKGQIAYIPVHSGSAVAGATYNKWDFNYSFIYTGERYTRSDNSQKYFVPAWYTHDLSMGRAFRIENVDCRATAEINNLLNQQYDVVDNYPMPGTNFKLILSITF